MTRLLRRQRGVSYPLGYALIAPFYLTILLFAVEAGFLLFAQLGTHYAAHMAARSAVVWRDAQPARLREDRVRQAAVTALAPFVGGRQRELDEAGPGHPEAEEEAIDFADAVREYEARAVAIDPAIPRPYRRSRTPPDAGFLQRKYRHADARLTLTLDPPLSAKQTDPHAETTVTVEFRAPLYLPVVSRFLDRDGTAPYEFPLSATATLPGDGPISRDRTVGIDYHSFPLTR